jgi:hypothetical protein
MGGDEEGEGRTYVVVFAPKLKKNCSSAKHTMNAGLLRSWNLPARMPTIHPPPFAQRNIRAGQRSGRETNVRAEQQNKHSNRKTGKGRGQEEHVSQRPTQKKNPESTHGTAPPAKTPAPGSTSFPESQSSAPTRSTLQSPPPPPHQPIEPISQRRRLPGIFVFRKKRIRSPLTRHEPKGGDDDPARRDLEQARPRRPRGPRVPDLLQHHVLVQVDAVEPAPIPCSVNPKYHDAENSRLTRCRAGTSTCTSRAAA